MALSLQTKLTYFYYLLLKGSCTTGCVPNDIFKFGDEIFITDLAEKNRGRNMSHPDQSKLDWMEMCCHNI